MEVSFSSIVSCRDSDLKDGQTPQDISSKTQKYFKLISREIFLSDITFFIVKYLTEMCEIMKGQTWGVTLDDIKLKVF